MKKQLFCLVGCLPAQWACFLQTKKKKDLPLSQPDLSAVHKDRQSIGRISTLFPAPVFSRQVQADLDMLTRDMAGTT
jgi:hypothetical protein